MNPTDVTNFNIVASVLGGWIVLFGAFSHLIKERLYLSEAVISLLAGVFLTYAVHLLKPDEYAMSKDAVASITKNFGRLVLSVQVVLTGVQLPSRYLSKERFHLFLILGPGMVGMWICSSGIIWMLIPRLSIVEAMAIGACITPTDPVLSTAVLKGKFAEENLSVELRNLISAESGSNDGLGYPFLFLALYIIKYAGGEESYDHKGPFEAVKLYLGEIFVYAVALSVVYGAIVGFLARKLLYWVERNKFVDRESFLLFPFALAVFTLGTSGIIGCDDILACFIAGNAFAWNDWFRQKTVDDPIQHTLDMLLNMCIFIWLGAVCPWASFVSSGAVTFPRLLFLGVLIVLLRRLPVMMALQPHIDQMPGPQQAIFVGYFGPIGISAIFYLYLALEYLESIESPNDGTQRKDIKELGETMSLVVWFSVISSVVAHGFTLSFGKGLYHCYERLTRRRNSINLV